MKRLMLTYFFFFSLQILGSGLCYAFVTTEPVVNAMAKVNEYAEQGTTFVEDGTTAAKDYIDGKMGAMGDIQNAAKKAEKTKKKAAWVKKQADKAKKIAEDAKKFAKDAKAEIDKAKKFAADVKSEVDKAKSEIDKVKSDIEDAKQQVNDIKDTAKGMKEMAGSALDQAKAKAGDLQEKAGIESSPKADVAAQAAEALTKQSAQVANKASAIGDLSMQAIPSEENLTAIDALPSQETVALSVDEVMNSAQKAPLSERNIDNLEPVQGLSIAEVNELGTLDIKAKQVLAAEEAKVLKATTEAEMAAEAEENDEANMEEGIEQENPNKVQFDPEAAAKLEGKLQDKDVQKKMELKAFYSGRKAFAAPAKSAKQLGGHNE